MKRFLVGLLILVVVLGVGTELFLPRAVERGVTAALARATGEQDLAVFLESHPVLRMMLGEFSTVTVENTDVSVDGLAFRLSPPHCSRCA